MIDRPNRPRTLKDVAAPQGAADRERLERAEHLMDPPREGTIIEDQARNGDWRVEYFGRDSAGYVTIFTGPEAERRARDYFQALKRSRGFRVTVECLVPKCSALHTLLNCRIGEC